jgi:RNase adaptor protein for sRNA GlmZ degradation
MIVSFGFDKGPPSLFGPAKVFDVRDVTHVETDPSFATKREEIVQYAKDHPRENIMIGCVKGRHRSPRLASDVAKALHVSVWHREGR